MAGATTYERHVPRKLERILWRLGDPPKRRATPAERTRRSSSRDALIRGKHPELTVYFCFYLGTRETKSTKAKSIGISRYIIRYEGNKGCTY